MTIDEGVARPRYPSLKGIMAAKKKPLESKPAQLGPVRVTVQFYKATSNGIVSDIDLDSISRSIGSVYEHADFVGSLVLPEGDPRRPTAWQRVPHEWFPW